MRKRAKKLVLAKETVTNLTVPEARMAKGALSDSCRCISDTCRCMSYVYACLTEGGGPCDTVGD
jgi:hypothetical protein